MTSLLVFLALLAGNCLLAGINVVTAAANVRNARRNEQASKDNLRLAKALQAIADEAVNGRPS